VATPPPTVSVILPCRNEAGRIEACLTSILRQHEPEGGFEVIVADGMSSDGTRQILARLATEISGQSSVVSGPSPGGLEPLGERGKEFAGGEGPARAEQAGASESLGQGEGGLAHPSSDLRASTSVSSLSSASGPLSSDICPLSTGDGPVLRLIDNPGQIVSTGLNAAIRTARGEIIIRMDAHTEYAPDYVRQCVAVLRATGADNTGGPARTQARSYMERAVAAAYHAPFAVGGARFHDVAYEGYLDTVTYGCWRRSAFDRFGYFDEELVRNQDDEHNLRIVRAGGRIYQSPAIKSWYVPRASLGALFRQYLQYGYWKVRVIQKHKLPASWRHLVPATFLFTLSLLFLLSAFCFLLSALTTDHRPLTSVLCPLSSGLLVLALSVYLVALLAACIVTAARSGWTLLPVLPAVFACYHFSYGWGFLHGIWDFVVRKRGARKSFQSLTR